MFLTIENPYFKENAALVIASKLKESGLGDELLVKKFYDMNS